MRLLEHGVGWVWPKWEAARSGWRRAKSRKYLFKWCVYLRRIRGKLGWGRSWWRAWHSRLKCFVNIRRRLVSTAPWTSCAIQRQEPRHTHQSINQSIIYLLSISEINTCWQSYIRTSEPDSKAPGKKQWQLPSNLRKIKNTLEIRRLNSLKHQRITDRFKKF